MALEVGDRADREILYRMIGTSVAGSNTGCNGDTFTLRLYKGRGTLTKSDSKAYFIQATGTGYAYIVLTPTSWTINTLNPGTQDTTMASYAQQTFTFSGSDSIAGYMVWCVRARTSGTSSPTAPTAGVSDSILMWAEKFSDGPYSIPGGGGTIKVTPRLIVS
jgi:hypothetical protein